MTTTTLPTDNRPTITTTPANATGSPDTTHGPRRRIALAATAVVLVAAAAGGAAYLAFGSDQSTSGPTSATQSVAVSLTRGNGIGADTGALVGHGTAVLDTTSDAGGSSIAGGDTGALVGHGTTTVIGPAGVAGTDFGGASGSATGSVVGHGTTTVD